MPESGTYGSVRGVPGNGHRYRDPQRASGGDAERVVPAPGTIEMNGCRTRLARSNEHRLHESVFRAPTTTPVLRSVRLEFSADENSWRCQHET
jgi:hypothetical protein